jgi:hypothetical protein
MKKFKFYRYLRNGELVSGDKFPVALQINGKIYSLPLPPDTPTTKSGYQLGEGFKVRLAYWGKEEELFIYAPPSTQLIFNPKTIT